MQEKFKENERLLRQAPRRPGPNTRYALAGIGRCGTCGGSIGAVRVMGADRKPVPTYACLWHHARGPTVCSVCIRQPTTAVEAALAAFLAEKVLSPNPVVLVAMRDEIERQLASVGTDTTALEAELKRLRVEQKNLLRAIRLGEGIEELVAELKVVSDRVRVLECDLTAARRTPAMVGGILAEAEEAVRRKLADLASALAADPAGAREVYRELFPEGLIFRPAEGSPRRWAIEGSAEVGKFNLKGDPNGI